MARTTSRLPPSVPVAAGTRSLVKLLDAVLNLHPEHDLRGLLRTIVRDAVDLVDARDGALGVLDQTGTRVVLQVTPDETTYLSTAGPAEDQWFLSLLVAEARPTRLPDERAYPRYDRSLLVDHPPRTFLGVPVWTRGIVFGHLYVTDKITSECFSPIDEALVVSLAAAGGVAVENAERYAWCVRHSAARAPEREVPRHDRV